MWRQVVAHWVCRVNAVAGDPVDVPVPYPARRRSGARPAAALAFQPPPCIKRRTAPILSESRRTYLSPLPNRAVARYPGNAGKSVAELRDKFAAAALKWPDTGLQLPAR
jgi:hypothetical protein